MNLKQSNKMKNLLKNIICVKGPLKAIYKTFLVVPTVPHPVSSGVCLSFRSHGWTEASKRGEGELQLAGIIRAMGW